MKFLQTKYQFKAVVQHLEIYLRAKKPDQKICELELAGVLLREAKLRDGDAFADGVQRLTSMLNSGSSIRPSRSELLQLLSRAFVGESYQQYEARIKCPTSFRELFPDAEVSPCPVVSGERIEHPFPLVYRKMKYLNEWRQVWERDAVSTSDCPFMPPMLPLSYFGGGNVNYVYRRSWRYRTKVLPFQLDTSPDAKAYRDQGTCCVLVHNARGEPMAGVRWYWWGHAGQMAGVEYTMLLRRQGKWFFTQFDLRHDRHDPSCGPLSEMFQGERPRGFVQDCLVSMGSVAPSTL